MQTTRLPRARPTLPRRPAPCSRRHRSASGPAATAAQEAQAGLARRLFEPGQKVLVSEGPFAGVEAIFELNDGQARAMVLIELIGRQVSLAVHPAALRAVN